MRVRRGGGALDGRARRAAELEAERIARRAGLLRARVTDLDGVRRRCGSTAPAVRAVVEEADAKRERPRGVRTRGEGPRREGRRCMRGGGHPGIGGSREPVGGVGEKAREGSQRLVLEEGLLASITNPALF
jgi:hypothetical protein